MDFKLQVGFNLDHVVSPTDLPHGAPGSLKGAQLTVDDEDPDGNTWAVQGYEAA